MDSEDSTQEGTVESRHERSESCILPQFNLKCRLATGALVPFPGDAEKQVSMLGDIAWEVGAQRCFGRAVLTNYRLTLEPSGSMPRGMTDMMLPMELAWGAVACVDRSQEKVVDAESQSRGGKWVDVVRIQCTDFRVIRMLILDASCTDDLMDAIQHMSRSGDYTDRPSAFVEMYGPTHAWHLLEWDREFMRLGVTQKWRFYENTSIESYPCKLVVPHDATDAEIATTFSARARKRFPVLTWCHRTKGSALLRCSQPLGVDDKYVERCRLAVHPRARLVFFDCRSKSAVLGNRLILRGGQEKATRYRSRMPMRTGDANMATVVGWDLPNIHAMRQSYIKLQRLVTDAVREDKWFQYLGDTEWLDHCRKLTEAALTLARILDGVSPTQPPVCVIVHCSDGWDRTTQVCSLAEVLLDPFYRTKLGLCILIEKDWVAFGHRFRSRSRHLSEGESPIFQQWLFCLAGVCRQFPELFEYDSDDLVLLLDLFLSQWTQTLSCDDERERRGLFRTHVSLWSLWLDSMETPDAQVPHLLVPLLSMKFNTLWDFALRYDEVAFRQRMRLRATDDVELSGWPPQAVWWLRDECTKACMYCRRPFTWIRRRKHCRACGLIFCQKCVYRADLPSLGYKGPQKVCPVCFELNWTMRSARVLDMTRESAASWEPSAENALAWAESKPQAANSNHSRRTESLGTSGG